MRPEDVERWKGVVDLASTGVERVTGLVEKHHRRAAGRVFATLDAVPVVAPPARVVRAVHDAVLSVTYGAILGTNRAIRTVGVVATDLLGDAPGGTQPGAGDDGPGAAR